MRASHLILAIIALPVAAVPGAAQDAALDQQIMAAYDTLNKAFETQNTATIRAMSTADHVSITPAFRGGKSLDKTIDAVSKMNITQKPVGDMTIDSLAPDVALQTFRAEMTGTFDGQPVARMLAVTIIWLKEDGAWKERLYQETPFAE